MLSIEGDDLAKLTIFRYWGNDLAKFVIFRCLGGCKLEIPLLALTIIGLVYSFCSVAHQDLTKGRAQRGVWGFYPSRRRLRG